MKKILFSIILFSLVLLMHSYGVKAQDGELSFDGLYLIDGENIQLDKIDIDVTVDTPSTSEVVATYEFTNTGKDTEYFYLGTPINDTKIDNLKLWCSVPGKEYAYAPKTVSGKEINSNIEEINVDYENWHTYTFPLAIQPGEAKTARIGLSLGNNNPQGGKVTILINMENLKTWGQTPASLIVEGHFNPQNTEIYNFVNDFSIDPSEMTSEYVYKWELNSKKNVEDINFSYYFIDETIVQQILGIGNTTTTNMIKTYKEKKYDNAIDLGKQYIENNPSSENQTKVYLLLADAYIKNKQYSKALAVYDLIEINSTELENISSKINDKNIYNKVLCYEALKDYSTMYNTIEYELSSGNHHPYMNEWLEKQISKIPQNEIKKIEEAYKPPTPAEKFINEFLNGGLSIEIIAVLGILVIIIAIIIYIIRKRRKNKYFF